MADFKRNINLRHAYVHMVRFKLTVSAINWTLLASRVKWVNRDPWVNGTA